MAEHLKARRFTIDDVLRVVERHCLTGDMAKLLGCNTTTVRRYLRKAELLGYVIESQGTGTKVWELTEPGAARLGSRP